MAVRVEKRIARARSFFSTDRFTMVTPTSSLLDQTFAVALHKLAVLEGEPTVTTIDNPHKPRTCP
jgi:hypothetical protein